VRVDGRRNVKLKKTQSRILGIDWVGFVSIERLPVFIFKVYPKY
jgi:hypothetical protein